jgi:hypothetical protein
MSDSFDILDVSDWPVDQGEASGGEEKAWLRHPDGSLWLFKPRTEQATWSQGEDWAEKISAHVAAALGVPAAPVELADRAGRRGTVSRSLRPSGWELQHGSLLLAELVPGYEAMTKDRRGHTLDNIRRVLDGVAGPVDPAVPGDLTAFDIFAAYLMLDAVIANQDRHEENWAVLRSLPGEGPMRLCGSYDHGSSLGFNLMDAKRQQVIEAGLARWAGRGRAQRFEQATDGRLSLVELAGKALAATSEAARSHWLGCLARVSPSSWDELVAQVPEMSDPARTFAGELLKINHGRMHDEFSHAQRTRPDAGRTA